MLDFAVMVSLNRDAEENKNIYSNNNKKTQRNSTANLKKVRN